MLQNAPSRRRRALSSLPSIHATDATRALLRAAGPRVHGGHEDVIFSEELNFNEAFVNVSCCHTPCLAALRRGLAGLCVMAAGKQGRVALWLGLERKWL